MSGDVIPSLDSSGRFDSVDDGLQAGGNDYGDVDDEDHIYCLPFSFTSCTFRWPWHWQFFQQSQSPMTSCKLKIKVNQGYCEISESF